MKICNKNVDDTKLSLAILQYVCQTDNISFVYSNLTFPANVHFALKIKDVGSAEYFCAQNAVDHVEYLYANTCSPYSVALAVDSYDITGLLKICKDWKTWDAEYNDKGKLTINCKNAIIGGNIEWLQYMLGNTRQNTTAFLRSRPTLIETAYHTQNLKAAKLLREFGAKANHKYFASTNMITSEAGYLQHLKEVNGTDVEKSMAKLLYVSPVLNTSTSYIGHSSKATSR